MDSIKVKFLETESGELRGFEVLTQAGHPLHHRVDRALDRLNLRITQRESRTDKSGSRQRVHVASKDGTPIGGATRLKLQALLLTSVSRTARRPFEADRGAASRSGPTTSAEAADDAGDSSVAG